MTDTQRKALLHIAGDLVSFKMDNPDLSPFEREVIGAAQMLLSIPLGHMTPEVVCPCIKNYMQEIEEDFPCTQQ